MDFYFLLHDAIPADLVVQFHVHDLEWFRLRDSWAIVAGILDMYAAEASK